MYENNHKALFKILRIHTHSSTGFLHQETKDRNGYKELTNTLDDQPVLARKVHQPAIARLSLFLFSDFNKSLAQLLDICLFKFF